MMMDLPFAGLHLKASDIAQEISNIDFMASMAIEQCLNNTMREIMLEVEEPCPSPMQHLGLHVEYQC